MTRQVPPSTAFSAASEICISRYDFLIDSAQRIERLWQAALPPLASIDADLVGSSWTATELRDHLCGGGGGGAPYQVLNLNGRATHYLEGVPGAGPSDIQGIDTGDLVDPAFCASNPLDLSGRVIYTVGCHSGLPVDDFGGPNDNTLDLPQAMLARGAMAYIGNTGYGWGLRRGIGYGERGRLPREELKKVATSR